MGGWAEGKIYGALRNGKGGLARLVYIHTTYCSGLNGGDWENFFSVFFGLVVTGWVNIVNHGSKADAESGYRS